MFRLKITFYSSSLTGVVYLRMDGFHCHRYHITGDWCSRYLKVEVEKAQFWNKFVFSRIKFVDISCHYCNPPNKV